MSWYLRGSYFEACNCDAVCPCRRVDGVPGGRSTHGVCLGVLSWLIEEGEVDGVEVSGLPVALALRYADDEPGSPWTWILYVGAAASEAQVLALDEAFSGRLGGDAVAHFPWAWKESEHVATTQAEIELSHEPRRQWLRVRDRVTVEIRGVHAESAAVTCVIPGHDRSGEELETGELTVSDGPLSFSYRGVCGYASTFDYRG